MAAMTPTTATAQAQPAVAVPNFPGPLLAHLRDHGRDFYYSLRLHRDVILDRWIDRIDDLREEYAEDRRQIRAHVCRARYSLRDRLDRVRAKVREKGEQKKQPDSFPKFAFLPAEIRLQIWEEAIPGPRAVMLRSPYGITSPKAAASSSSPSRRTTTAASRTTEVLQTLGFRPKHPQQQRRERHFGWTSPTPAPGMLHANRESRSIALKRYRPVLGAASSPGPIIYADLERDYICLSGAELDPRCNALWRETADASEIRRLAIAAFWGPCSGYHHHHVNRHQTHVSLQQQQQQQNSASDTSDDNPDELSDSDNNQIQTPQQQDQQQPEQAQQDHQQQPHHRGHGLPLPIPPPPLGPAFENLQDVMMVRSLRWQYGRLPRAAKADFSAWVEREKAAEGVSHFRTWWRRPRAQPNNNNDHEDGGQVQQDYGGVMVMSQER